MVVGGEHLDALARLDLDRRDFLGEAAGLPRGIGELLAAERVAVLFLARDAVLRSAVLGGRRHRATAVRVEKRSPEVVLELSLSESKPTTQPADDVRRLAHALGAAGEDHIGFVEQDLLPATDG